MKPLTKPESIIVLILAIVGAFVVYKSGVADAIFNSFMYRIPR